MPAFRPTRGSGLGGDAFMLEPADGAGAVEVAVDVEPPHAARSDNDTRHEIRATRLEVRVVTATVPGW
jgi:hypothetical protein